LLRGVACPPKKGAWLGWTNGTFDVGWRGGTGVIVGGGCGGRGPFGVKNGGG
jgi:hypothetical protein